LTHFLIILACVAVSAYQLWRIPRVWAFLVLFIALMPKVPLAVVPGNTTPIRVDDVVLAIVLIWWARNLFQVRLKPDATDPPPSPATFFLLIYWGIAIACTLIGMAALTTGPLTGVLHAGRLVQYGLLYYFFYSTIAPDEFDRLVEVVRTAVLLLCALWTVQHWTHAPAAGPPTPWATLYPTFSASYDFGGYMMLATILLYALWSEAGSRSLLTTLALVTGAIVTANSESRASLLGLALIVAIDLIWHARWRSLLALGVAAAAAPYVIASRKMLTLVYGVASFATSLDVDVIRQAIANDPSLALRAKNWRLAFEHWLARPFLGDGLGGYLAYVRQYDLPASPDGWYVRVLADTGVAGFVAFAVLLVALLWLLARAARATPRGTQPLPRAIVYGAALAVVATSASAVLVDVFVSYKIMGMFWMVIAAGTRVSAHAWQAACAPRPAVVPVPPPALPALPGSPALS
jgi:O-antigen ligase